MPFLRIQDRVVLCEPQSTHVLTLVHHSRSRTLHMTVAKAVSRTTTSCQGMLHLMGWMETSVRNSKFKHIQSITSAMLRAFLRFELSPVLRQALNAMTPYQATINSAVPVFLSHGSENQLNQIPHQRTCF